MEGLGLIAARFCDEDTRSGSLISHERGRKTEIVILIMDTMPITLITDILNIIASKLTCLINVKLDDLDSYRAKEINIRYETLI